MMNQFRTRQDVKAIEAEMPWADRDIGRTMYEFLSRAAKSHGPRPAVTFQLTAGAKDRAQTLTWDGLLDHVTQAANLLRALGVGPQDVVAYVLPNALETVVTLLAGAVAGIVCPINPLLEAAQIAALEDGKDPALKSAVEDFRADEAAHRDTALAAGAEQAPGYKLLSETIKAGCRIAIKLSERI